AHVLLQGRTVKRQGNYLIGNPSQQGNSVIVDSLKRLIDKGWLAEHQRGQFSIVEGLNGAALNGAAADH
ncbi:hypothetical protein AB0F17_66285, partial [Nonomuraea sp. NPDC026600]|uniref:hypothetical protein n=1 Tax=Nonomuraea sp. NPDC026600 TaxID=3155363 RepID=UPI0033FD9361